MLHSVVPLIQSSVLETNTQNQFAAVKMNMTSAAQISHNIVNQLPTPYVAKKVTLTAMENAGQKINHAVMLQLSTAQVNMINVLNTAVAMITKNVAKRENNANHLALFAADGTNLTAMENVFQKVNTAAQLELHGAITLTLVKNTVAIRRKDSSGAKKQENVIPTVAHTTLFGAHTLTSALIMKNTAAH